MHVGCMEGTRVRLRNSKCHAFLPLQETSAPATPGHHARYGKNPSTYLIRKERLKDPLGATIFSRTKHCLKSHCQRNEASPFALQPSQKSFRTKQKLAKKQKQNRPIPQWIRFRTGNKIRYAVQQLKGCELATTVPASDRTCVPRYNAKRRHWRRTKLNL